MNIVKSTENIQRRVDDHIFPEAAEPAAFDIASRGVWSRCEELDEVGNDVVYHNQKDLDENLW